MESVDGSQSMGEIWGMSIQWVGLGILPPHVLYTSMIALGTSIAAIIFRTVSWNWRSKGVDGPFDFLSCASHR